MNIDYPNLFIKIKEINNHIFGLIYMKNVNSSLVKNKISLKTFNFRTLQKKIIEKDFKPQQRSILFNFFNPSIIVNISRGNIKVLFITNPEKSEYYNGKEEITYHSESFRLLDIY